jgi:hypothetical protein
VASGSCERIKTAPNALASDVAVARRTDNHENCWKNTEKIRTASDSEKKAATEDAIANPMCPKEYETGIIS